MPDKKHIDRLFQERFKDFEATPRDEVWTNIEAKLNEKKKKRRLIPIWWRYAGVAALLLLLLTVGSLYFNKANGVDSNNQIVDTENTDVLDNQINTFEESTVNNKASVNNNTSTPASNTSSDASIEPDENYINNALNKSSNTRVAFTDNNDDSKKANSSNTASHKEKPSSNFATNKALVENTQEKPSAGNKDNNTVLQNNKNNAITYSKGIQGNSKSSNPDALKTENNQITSKKNSIISSTENEKTEVAKTVQESNSKTIEEALEENKVVLEEPDEAKTQKWSIAPNAAPVYFNTLGGNGSSIDPQFNSNSKTGDINMSYGIAASYAINKKIKIRSGVNKVNLGYNTNDVVLFRTVGVSSSRSALKNVEPSSGSDASFASDVSVVSAEVLDNSAVPETLTSSNNSINQSLGFIEIPLEVQYTLSDRKLGVNLIGGFSSFFLNDNEIYSESSSGNRTLLGEASNINDLSYSANLGLGLSYKIGKQIDLNLEPMFKYQFNTFKNTSGSFTPYFIGVYTGFAIKF